MRHYWLGSILLSTALSSPAVTLGLHNGVALLGRPLDLRVQVTLAPGESPNELCIRPEVFYGDSQVSSGNVTATLQQGPSGTEASLRIQSLQPINEPIVTVSVRVGCTSVFSRRYVLLADPVSEAAATSRSIGGPVAVPVPPLVSVPAGPLPGSAAAPAAPQRSARAASQAGRQAAAAQDAVPRASVVRKPAPAPARPAVPRLELDLLDIDLAIERDPVLKLSSRLLSEPVEDNPQARQAAIQLWKAINAAPEDILRDQQRLEALEAESKTLRELETRSREQVMALEARLQEGERLRWIGYALAGVLLLALIAALWRRRASPKREEAGMPAWAGAAAGRGHGPRAADDGETASAQVDRTGRRRVTPVDIELNLEDDASLLSDIPAPDMAGAANPKLAEGGAEMRPELASAQAIAARSVATEELFDVQQQADFFMSLGEHEQAIRVLREHLDESHEPSPLTYLDLFQIYHHLGRRDEYEALRTDFNEVFNAGAPPFEQYSTRSRGLESYEKAFSRIQALWPQPKVLELIERSIFRDNQMAGEEVFDLEAYRELLLLYAIAKDMIQRDASAGEPPNDFQHTSLKPLNAAVTRIPGMPEPEGLLGKVTEPMDGHLVPSSSNIGLDIDLDALSEVSAFEASLPEVDTPVEPTSRASAPQADDAHGNMIDFELLDFTPPDADEDGENRP